MLQSQHCECRASVRLGRFSNSNYMRISCRTNAQGLVPMKRPFADMRVAHSVTRWSNEVPLLLPGTGKDFQDFCGLSDPNGPIRIFVEGHPFSCSSMPTLSDCRPSRPTPFIPTVRFCYIDVILLLVPHQRPAQKRACPGAAQTAAFQIHEHLNSKLRCF